MDPIHGNQNAHQDHQKQQVPLSQQSTSAAASGGEFYYPNTDLSVWLRTCNREVETPIPGQITFGKNSFSIVLASISRLKKKKRSLFLPTGKSLTCHVT